LFKVAKQKFIKEKERTYFITALLAMALVMLDLLEGFFTSC
jgi:hypothetical protein